MGFPKNQLCPNSFSTRWAVFYSYYPNTQIFAFLLIFTLLHSCCTQCDILHIHHTYHAHIVCVVAARVRKLHPGQYSRLGGMKAAVASDLLFVGGLYSVAAKYCRLASSESTDDLLRASSSMVISACTLRALPVCGSLRRLATLSHGAVAPVLVLMLVRQSGSCLLLFGCHCSM